MSMNICCILFTISDMILLVTAIILLFTLFVMKKGNEENARLNRLQAVENTILKQIEFHNNLLKGISVNIESTGRGFGTPNAPIDAIGQEAFEIFYDRLKNIYITMPGFYKPDMNDEERRIKDSFTQLYKEYGSLFGNYFKNLYLLVKYINDKKIKDFDKSYYFDLVKSQLSKYEILLLAYDCIWIQDKPKGENFIELAKNNNLLSALETDELIKSASTINHIDIFSRYEITFRKPVEFTN
jgi:hypothetical protein